MLQTKVVQKYISYKKSQGCMVLSPLGVQLGGA